MIFNGDELTALEAGTVRVAIFFRLETVPVVRIWLGIGNIQPGINVYDVTGAEYKGFGAIQNVPSFNQLVNGKAERIEFTISGVSGDIHAIASGGDAQQVKGKRVAIGLAVMAADWSLLGPVHWCANYFADFLSVQQAETDDPLQPVVRSITLSCRSLLTARRRPSYSYFTDQDQQARFPGDRFCERVSVYANGFNKTWPTFPPPP